MARTLKLRYGISDSPSAVQPTLGDCVQAVTAHADVLMRGVLAGLDASLARSVTRQNVALCSPAAQAAIHALLARTPAVAARFKSDLSQQITQGAAHSDAGAEMLRFDDLQLFEDADLSLSIEVARAEQEVAMAVDDVLPPLDALVSSLLGWRTVQAGLNPLRPLVFVRALQACLASEVPDPAVRDALITPMAGLMGAELRTLYREITDWLRNSGVEPAVAAGSRMGGGGSGVQAAMARTLLNLDKLRRLLAGDFDDRPQSQDFLPTVPESLVALQQQQQLDALVQRLADRPTAQAAGAWEASTDIETPKLGHLLGAEVVGMMFDNLVQDARVLPPLKQSLRRMERLMTRLGREDSRFFTDRRHAGRRLLDTVIQRSLAYPTEAAPGWADFISAVDGAVAGLADAVVDADALGELTDRLQAQWVAHDQAAQLRRAEAARALAHAEQRHMLALKLSADFAQAMAGLEVAEFVRDFLLRVWPQVVAEARLSNLAGDDDPHGYRTAVDDLVWSVQRSTAQRGRARRLEKMIPGLVDQLRAGLQRIDYPAAHTEQFFQGLAALHSAALQDGRDPETQAVADAVEAAPSAFADSVAADADPWLADHEVAESGYVDGQSILPPQACAPADEAAVPAPVGAAPVAQAPEAAPEIPPLDNPSALRTGSWVELTVNGAWLRVQLTWATPHATLFMFTSAAGTAHSMSRRTLERLYQQGQLRTIAARPVVDEALDQVAKAALRNSLSEPR